MTTITNKLEKVHVNFWGIYNLPSQFGSFYIIIFIYKHIQKAWTLNLQRKDVFVDVF